MRFVTLLIAFLCTAIGLSAKVTPGEKAPNFTLTSATGEQVSLDQYKGKYVVLEWVNPGCPFVRKHYNSGNMQELQAKAKGMDVVWLSINSTSAKSPDYLDPAASVKYYGEKGVKSTWLLDASGEVAKTYGATRTPEMFVIDPTGTVIYHGAIDSINSANADDIKKADNFVLAALSESKNGKPVSKAVTRPYGCTIKQ